MGMSDAQHSYDEVVVVVGVAVMAEYEAWNDEQDG